MKFSYNPSVGCIEVVIDYQAGAGEKRDFRRWKFDGVKSVTCDGKPWEGTQDEWQVFMGQFGKQSPSLYYLSLSPVRAVSGKTVAYKLDLELDKPISHVTFTFTALSAEQRFGFAIAMKRGKLWTHQDTITGKQFDFYHPFPDEE